MESGAGRWTCSSLSGGGSETALRTGNGTARSSDVLGREF